MRYTVTWHPDALDELARAWIEAADRSGVTRAVQAIESTLRDEPADQGQEFYGDRIMVATPLAVTFAVHVEDRIVQVLQVWSRAP
jgi:hypothetical protein